MSKRKKASEPQSPLPSDGLSAERSSLVQPSLVTRIFSEYRFLAVVLSLACLLGGIELLRKDLPKSTSEVRPEWLLNQKNLANTLVTLYPDRANGHLYRAYQASMCFENKYQPEVCTHFEHKDLRDVREEWEAVIGTGNKEQEEAFRNYAYVLYVLGEADEAEAVVKYWRANYPHSTKPDPRDEADLMLVESNR